MIPDIQNLQHYCRSKFPDKHAIVVSGISYFRSGVESDVYFFRIEHGTAQERLTEELVLRLYTRADAYEKSLHEFSAMRQLREAGYPVPRVLAVEREHSPFNRPFLIMERVVGQEMWQLLNGSSQQRQKEVLTQLSGLLVQLHGLQCQPFADERNQFGDAGNPIPLDRWLASFNSLLGRFPIAGLERVFQWLMSKRAELSHSRPSLVHSDFHPGNVLVRSDGSAVVVDWAGLEISDPRFDVGHTLLLLNCVAANSEWRDTALAAYEQLTAGRVEYTAYFEVAACFKWFLALTVSLRYGPDSLGLGADAVSRLNPPRHILKKAHDLLHTWTAIRVPEIETLLAPGYPL